MTVLAARSIPCLSIPIRLLASGALGAALVLASAAQAGAVDLTDPTVATKDGLQVMHVLGHETDGRFIPKGGDPTDHPTGEPKPGDGFSFVEELRQEGALVGTDTGVCTILPGAEHAARCEVTVMFPTGTMTVVGVGTEAEKKSTYKLTGGTGAYQGVSGVVRAIELNDTDSDLTFEFKTPPAEPAAPPKGAPAEPKVTAAGSKQMIHVVTENTGDRFLPKGGEPTDKFPDEKNPPKPGDAFSFTEDLEQDGTLVGRDKGGCTFGSPVDGPLHCAVTLSFPKGYIDVEGAFVDGQVNAIKLTQGTGAYEGIAGMLKVTDIDEDHTDLVLTFTTPGTAGAATGSSLEADATQVSVVPVGGAATGAGSTAEGVDRGLVGLGAIAAAAGAGLFGFGRRVGRRAR